LRLKKSHPDKKMDPIKISRHLKISSMEEMNDFSV